MKLTGVINSLGGYHTIRGFAPLADIAKISKAEKFQRNLIFEHVSEIKEFFRKKRNLFFPEIVLSYTLKYDYNAADSITGIDPIREIAIENKEFRSNIDKITIKPLKTEVGKQRVVEITIQDDWLNNNQPFSRIDGNHRITAFIEENDFSPLEEFSTPFCLILFPDIVNSRNREKIIFHNINSKARPLTTEEELKNIIENVGFSDEELKDNFGAVFYYTRELAKLFKPDNLNNLQNFFYNNSISQVNTVLLKIIEFLKFNNLLEEPPLDYYKILNAIAKVNNVFNEKENIINSNNIAFLISAVGIELNARLNLSSYSKWLHRNHLSELKEVQAQSIYDIYCKIALNYPKIFVAMPYFGDAQVESYNSCYKRVVDKINDENADLKLELYPIMTHRGETKDIVNEMISQIRNCSIFIADISTSNVNVGYELGYARSKGIPTIIVKRENDDSKTPFDYEHDSRKTYDPLAIGTLEQIIYSDVKEILNNKR